MCLNYNTMVQNNVSGGNTVCVNDNGKGGDNDIMRSGYKLNKRAMGRWNDLWKSSMGTVARHHDQV